jgi:hypothetical protein
MDKQKQINLSIHIFRIVKHQSSAFTNENLTDKLRIQIYQTNRNQSGEQMNSSNLIGKKDISLHSIVSRELFASFIHNDHSLSDLPTIDSQPYSSFSHGNSLNAMMGLNNVGNSTGSSHLNGMKGPRHNEANKNMGIFQFIFYVQILLAFRANLFGTELKLLILFLVFVRVQNIINVFAHLLYVFSFMRIFKPSIEIACIQTMTA